MDIKNLEVRMYYLAGQLDEAKKIYKEAVAELEKINKETEEKQVEAVVS